MAPCPAREQVADAAGINDEVSTSSSCRKPGSIWMSVLDLTHCVFCAQSLLAVIGSISFPWSFPIDMMHALFENIMKGFLDVWKGPETKRRAPDGSTLPDDPFVISKANWNAMAVQIMSSNSKVPSTMASRIHDLDNRGFWTAESYSYFAMFLGPIVLKDRLADEYYVNFLRFSHLVRTLIAVEIELDSLEDFEMEVGEWVKEFERCVVFSCDSSCRRHSYCPFHSRLYYRFQDKNLPFCTAPIHSLLHVVQNIRHTGPPCHTLVLLHGTFRRLGEGAGHE
jgi:hypothetical protein